MPKPVDICETAVTALETAAAVLDPICEALKPAVLPPQPDPPDWRQAVVALARTHLGYTEEPNGYTIFGRWYEQQVEDGPPFARSAWCGAFASYVFSRPGYPLPEMQHEGYSGFAKAEIGRAYAQTKGWGTSQPRPGDLVFLNWDTDPASEHVEIVSRVEDGVIWTIGGNVGAPGQGKVTEQPRSRASILLIADPSSAMRGGPCWAVPPYDCPT